MALFQQEIQVADQWRKAATSSTQMRQKSYKNAYSTAPSPLYYDNQDMQQKQSSITLKNGNVASTKGFKSSCNDLNQKLKQTTAQKTARDQAEKKLRNDLPSVSLDQASQGSKDKRQGGFMQIEEATNSSSECLQSVRDKSAIYIAEDNRLDAWNKQRVIKIEKGKVVYDTRQSVMEHHRQSQVNSQMHRALGTQKLTGNFKTARKRSSIAQFGQSHQSFMNELNKQSHVAINSFFNSKNVSFSRKGSQKANPDVQQIKQYLQNTPSKLSPQSVRTEVLKEQYVKEINRITNQRLFQANPGSKSPLSGRPIVSREISSNQVAQAFDAFKSSEKLTAQIQPQAQMMQYFEMKRHSLQKNTILKNMQTQQRRSSQPNNQQALLKNLQQQLASQQASSRLMRHQDDSRIVLNPRDPQISRIGSHESQQAKSGAAPDQNKNTTLLSLSYLLTPQGAISRETRTRAVAAQKGKSAECLRATAYQRLLSRIASQGKPQERGPHPLAANSSSVGGGSGSGRAGGGTKSSDNPAIKTQRSRGPHNAVMQSKINTQASANNDSEKQKQTRLVGQKLSSTQGQKQRNVSPGAKVCQQPSAKSAGAIKSMALVVPKGKSCAPIEDKSPSKFFYRFPYEAGGNKPAQGRTAEPQCDMNSTATHLTEGGVDMASRTRPNTTQDALDAASPSLGTRNRLKEQISSSLKVYLEQMASHQATQRPITHQLKGVERKVQPSKKRFAQTTKVLPSTDNRIVSTEKGANTATSIAQTYAKTYRPIQCDLAQIKKIKPDTQNQARVYDLEGTSTAIEVGVREFMEAQTSDYLNGESHLKSRLAINRINLYGGGSDANPENNFHRSPYLQSTQALDHILEQSDMFEGAYSMSKQVQAQQCAMEQKKRDQKLQDLAQKHNERMQMKLRLKELQQANKNGVADGEGTLRHEGRPRTLSMKQLQDEQKRLHTELLDLQKQINQDESAAQSYATLNDLPYQWTQHQPQIDAAAESSESTLAWVGVRCNKQKENKLNVLRSVDMAKVVGTSSLPDTPVRVGTAYLQTRQKRQRKALKNFDLDH